ncbi:MAG: dihydroorotate dehydrogenase electron transfer subunit [Nitrososphaerota archaeon]|nr:dihydroorotate dehydrogenase electron transfer subunit [Nitrososphaerota archaeon]
MFRYQADKPIDRPRIVSVKAVEDESPIVRTIYFDDEKCSEALPGQFIMVWIPGVKELPISLSLPSKKGNSAITVKPIGPGTNALYNVKPGDKIGVRGPYGTPFQPTNGKVLIVGGGTGLAPLSLLCYKYISYYTHITVIVGARTSNQLLFIDKFQDILKGKGRIIVTTDDGSKGYRGFASEVAEKLIKTEDFDMVYTCGPELMMKAIFKASEERGVAIQASLERVMRCGFGICGSCCIDRYLVCKDGPVFNTYQLRIMQDELGVYSRDYSGRRVNIH